MIQGRNQPPQVPSVIRVMSQKKKKQFWVAFELEDVRHPTAVLFLQTQDHREAHSSYHLLVITDDCPFVPQRDKPFHDL